MAIPIQNPGPNPPRPVPAKRRSVFVNALRGVGGMASGPVDWMGVQRIRRSASLIGDLWAMVRRGPRRDERFKTEEGRFDLTATAFSYGLSVEELEARLALRRRQTARIAYATAVLGCLFLLAWLWRALSSPWAEVRLSSAASFLPFCVLFLLVAFYNALLNFQLRIGRVAGWREYLMTNERFWPS